MEAARQAKRGAEARWAAEVDVSDPDVLASKSLKRLVRTGQQIQALAAGMNGREKLEAAKVLVSIDQTVLDRTVGRPRQVTGQDAPAQLAQYAQQMRAIFSGPADPPPEPNESE